MRDMPPEPGDVLELRVSLRDIQPEIWRGLRVPAAATLAELHRALQIVFGWDDYHLHAFEAGGIRFAPAIEDDWMFSVDERAAPLGAVARVGSSLVYWYDFGDDWMHDILVEHIDHDPQAGVSCTGGARACPPEDCGGPFGYQHLLEALADPDHEDHEQMVEWIGPRFDPEKFDASPVNRKLGVRKRAARSRAKRRR